MDSFLAEADNRFASGTFKYPGTAQARLLEARGWEAWLRELFGQYVKAGFADRHIDFWQWVWTIRRGERPQPFIGIWPRGGGKSTSAELAAVSIGARGARAYVLYICETQDQADEHVGNVGSMLESPLIEQFYPALASRRVGKYGSAKGWRREQLRTASGFNVSGIGLDVARRGAKLDEYRPDVIIIDDIDDINDTPPTVERKAATLAKSLLPAGSVDCAVLGMQNLIHANSIFSQFVDGRADFLTDRHISGPYKAVDDLIYEVVNGQAIITGGRPTWQGQDLQRCAEQIRTWGLESFKSESQQEVGTEGQFFTTWNAALHTCSPRPVDKGWYVWASLDHGFAHPTALYVHADTGDGQIETIAEHVLAGALPAEHAERIHALLAALGLTVRQLSRIVAGSDVFAQKGDKDGHTLAQQYAAHGITLTEANTERINGAAEMRRRLGNEAQGIRATWRIWTSCPRLIAQLPKLIADPKRKEDVLKVNANKHGIGGDDCFIAGTRIMTLHGERPIEQIAVGDMLLTRGGYRPVRSVWNSRQNADVVTIELSNGDQITATPNHPIWVQKSGWKCIDSVRYGDIIQPCQKSKQSSSTEYLFDGIRSLATPTTASITRLVASTLSRVWGTFMLRYGNQCTAQFLLDTISIIKTAIHSITTSAFWNASAPMIITPYTLPMDVYALASRSTQMGRRSASLLALLIGIVPKKAEPGTENMASALWQSAHYFDMLVNNVVLSTKQKTQRECDFVPTSARQNGDEIQGLIISRSHANAVENYLPAINTTRLDSVPIYVRGIVGTGKSDTYAIHVAEHHEYYANGVLVKNCYDSARYGLMERRPVWNQEPQSYGYDSY